ncbi:30S ribosome-binding factor RbfA [bacterium]|nr:MAG: 30S ribosome-binding factor RbfA [bacterium]
MQQHRIDRLNKLLFQSISNIVSFELRDNRLEEVSIEYVIVSPDMRDATVFFSVFNDEKMDLALAGLNSASKVIRKKLADILNLQFTPRLRFKFDKQEYKAQHIEDMIEKDGERYESE